MVTEFLKSKCGAGVGSFTYDLAEVCRQRLHMCWVNILMHFSSKQVLHQDAHFSILRYKFVLQLEFQILETSREHMLIYLTSVNYQQGEFDIYKYVTTSVHVCTSMALR